MDKGRNMAYETTVDLLMEMFEDDSEYYLVDKLVDGEINGMEFLMGVMAGASAVVQNSVGTEELQGKDMLEFLELVKMTFVLSDIEEKENIIKELESTVDRLSEHNDELLELVSKKEDK